MLLLKKNTKPTVLGIILYSYISIYRQRMKALQLRRLDSAATNIAKDSAGVLVTCFEKDVQKKKKHCRDNECWQTLPTEKSQSVEVI